MVVSPGRLDRSPCGTGTSARLAVLHARGLLAPGEALEHVSIIGSRFLGRIEETMAVGGAPAVVTTVAGRAWLTGVSQYGVDPDDPYPLGFTLPDTWFGRRRRRSPVLPPGDPGKASRMPGYDN